MLLEDENPIGARALNRCAVHQDLSGGLRVQAGYEVQKSGLAASGGPDDADELSGSDLKVDVVERKQAFAALRAIAQRDVVQADFGNSRHAGAHRAIQR